MYSISINGIGAEAKRGTKIYSLSRRLPIDNDDFIEAFLDFFFFSNSSLNILSAVELRLLFSEIDSLLDGVGLLFPLPGDMGPAVAMLSVLRLNELPRNEADEQSDALSP